VTSTSFTNKDNHRKILVLAGAASMLVVPFLIGSFSTHLETDQSFCPLKMISGLPCPGCGVTKSIYFFLTGDFLKSIHYHLFGPLVVIFCLFLIPQLLVEITSGRAYDRRFYFNKKLGTLAGISLGTYHFIRTVHFLFTHSLFEIWKESIWA